MRISSLWFLRNFSWLLPDLCRSRDAKPSMRFVKAIHGLQNPATQIRQQPALDLPLHQKRGSSTLIKRTAKFLFIALFIGYALQSMAISNQGFEEAMILPSAQDFPLPVKSSMTPGKVTRHSMQLALSSAFFVIGDDEVSRQWLKKNAIELKKQNAFGLVTNISSKEHLHELEALAGMPLQAVDVDELGTLLKVRHYPFVLTVSGDVWQ